MQENNFSPPISVPEVAIREIYFKMTLREWQEGFRVGLSHMTPLSQAIWCGLALLILGSRILMAWLKHSPITWPLTQLPPPPSLISLGSHTGATLFGYMIGAAFLALATQLRTAQITPSFLVRRMWGLSSRTYWKNVNVILETSEHICFCQNSPLAIVVPKRAFRNQKDAEVFLEQAKDYWQCATGRNQPSRADVPGVWPPAPSASNSVEPGDNRKRY